MIVCECCGHRFWYTKEELCLTCHSSMCPNCHLDHDGEVWLRGVIDKLWEDKWELYLITPKPPLEAWHAEGLEPAIVAERIKQNYKKPERRSSRKPPKRAPRRAPGIPG